MALKTMSVAKLQDLKSQVEAAISAKVSERRHELESELSKLDGHGGGARRGTTSRAWWTQGRGRPQVPQPRKSVRDLGRPWPQAEVAGSCLKRW